MKIGVIQLKVVKNKQENMERACNKIQELAQKGADMVVLPEMFNCPYDNSCFPEYAEPEGGVCFNRLSQCAKENSIYLVGGSMPEKDDLGRLYNTCYIFDPGGYKIGKHRKIHLFDIDVKGGQKFKESDTLTPGDKVTVFDTEFGKMGAEICYDYRFPELSRLMVDKGAKVIIVPAAFNMTTGPAHWELLFRQRAVDNQVFSIGTAPARDCEASYISYGNSIAVSPWGDVIGRLDEKESEMLIDLDLSMVDKVREQLPLLKHRRLDIYKLEEI
jgi:predicted amidohydrolase